MNTKSPNQSHDLENIANEIEAHGTSADAALDSWLVKGLGDPVDQRIYVEGIGVGVKAFNQSFAMRLRAIANNGKRVGK